MDYGVLLLSRIQEGTGAGRTTRGPSPQASSTPADSSAAAAIMAAFVSFALADLVVIKLDGAHALGSRQRLARPPRAL